MDLKKNLSHESLSKIKNLSLQSKLILKGSLVGLHNSPFHGYSSEFSQFRSYSSGDDLRHFDWKGYAKNEKLMIKQYREETNTNVYLIMDSSASMGYKGEAAFSKWEYASLLAASTALLAFQQRDAFSLVHGSTTPTIATSAKNSAVNLNNLFETLETTKPEGTTNLKELFQQIAPRLQSQSVTFVFSDFWNNPEDTIYGLKSIHHKSRACTLVQILSPEERDFFNSRQLELRDLETQLKIKISSPQVSEQYRNALEKHLEVLKLECRKRNIPILQICTIDPLFPSMRSLLKSA